VALTFRDIDKRVIYLINLGDTRAVLGKKGVATRLTVDHKASEVSEQERIVKSGGSIFRNRVGGSLAVTRALGDLDFRYLLYITII
jgi:protein phosphatase PTC1